MANIDLASLLTQPTYGGLPRSVALASLQSLSNQLYQNPHNAAEIRSQIQEMFGADVAKQVVDDALPTIGNQPISVQQGAVAPQNITVNDLLAQQDQASANNTIIPNLNVNPALNTPSSLPSVPSGNIAPTTTNQGGFFNAGNNTNYGNALVDTQRILAEAELQKNLASQTLTAQNDARKKYLTDLSGLLQEQQRQQLSTELPGIYEDLNTRGLLRSSGLGNELGRRQSELAAQTSSELARQGLTYSDEYTSGLGGIQNAYLGARNSALQRRFSLEDLDTNVRASKELGFALQPQPQSNSKGNTLAGTSVGASIGSAFGPVGTAIGGIAGGAASRSSK